MEEDKETDRMSLRKGIKQGDEKEEDSQKRS